MLSIIGLFFDFLKKQTTAKGVKNTKIGNAVNCDISLFTYTKKKGKAKPPPANTSNPVATNIFRSRDI